MWVGPELPKPTPQGRDLQELPPPAQRVPVAVYGFTDQTGQFKPSDSVQTLSRAVTQGATSILVKALQDAGNRQFFTVIERERLDNVLRERAVIREMRSTYLGERNLNTQALPPLLFAGVLLEGGVIGYDSNTVTGGAGARFLGIGASTKYRQDTITIFLRAVSTKTGEVLASVSVRKSIMSFAIGADAFRYVAFKDLLEAEAGITYNEPDQLALTQAIEKGVYSLIVEGALQDLWCFKTTPAAGAAIVTGYLAEREGVDKNKVTLPRDGAGEPVTGACRVRQGAALMQVPAGQLPPVMAMTAPAPAPAPASAPAPARAAPASAASAPEGRADPAATASATTATMIIGDQQRGRAPGGAPGL